MAPQELTRDVVIIGAGPSGLTAAYRLQKAGHSVAVLEARHRVGGRTWNGDINGAFIEIGGQWISPDQTALSALIEELGLETFSRYRTGDRIYKTLEGEVKRYSGDTFPVDEATAAEMDRLIKMMDELVAEVDPAAPWAHPQAKELDSISFRSWLKTHTDNEEARNNISLFIAGAMLTKPEHAFSALQALLMAASAGSFSNLVDEDFILDKRVLGGMQKVSLILAEKVGEENIILGHPVRVLRWQEEGDYPVLVDAESFSENGTANPDGGVRVRAKYAIMAVPPNLYSRVHFVPALNRRQHQMHMHQSMGLVIKVHAVYDKPFWREKGLSGTCFACQILVLSNLAGIAVDFFYLFLSQVLGDPDVADLAANNLINIATFIAFMAFGCYITYRGLDATQKLQTVLIIFQLLVLALFSAVALYKAITGTGFANLAFSFNWFNPFGIGSFSTLAASMSLVFFLYWGWDAVLTMNEETEGNHTTSGTAAVGTILTIVVLYLFLSVGTLSFAGTGEDGLGLGNPDNQENIFAALSGPVLGSLGILMSIAVMVAALASLQSTAVSPARTLLAMGYYRALGPKFAQLSPKYQAPSYATIASCLIATVFYVVMRFISTSVLWDTISALSLMVCLYYGITAFACVWYFRKTSLTSGAKNLFNKFIFPLLGGLILVIFFAQTFFDSMDPAYGSGSEIGGLGLVFILSLLLLLLGFLVMTYQRFKRPDFFTGKVPMDVEHMLDLPE